MVNAIIGAGLDLAAKIFEHVNRKQSRKYIDRIVSLKLELSRELNKALYHQDDKRIEELKEEMDIIMEAAAREIETLKAAKD